MSSAKKEQATGLVIHSRPKGWTHRQSVFWQQVNSFGNNELKLAVDEITDGAKALSLLVLKELPFFTKHDSDHLDNVLYWMEKLVTPAGLKELGPTGCAICIFLAYTHDLGMIPKAGWEKSLSAQDSQDALRFRQWSTEHHPDLLDLFDRCHADRNFARAEWISGYLKTDFLRATHADAGHESRVAEHLRRLASTSSLKKAFRFLGDENESVALLAELAASHNQKMDWLARCIEKRQSQIAVLGGGGDAYWRLHTAAGTTNVLLPALLLRLADICDFDKSRTPAVLFHQLGLEGFSVLSVDNNLGALPSEQKQSLKFSSGEWMKHLAVERWEWARQADGLLVYVVPCCPHPVVERSIHSFCNTIMGEVSGVRAEISRITHRGNCEWMYLPEKVEPAVSSRCGYIYNDIQFQLQAHEVTRLLMGTALYGNPELCIRELLQNALDAVQLRDLRIRLKNRFEEDLGKVPQDVYPFLPVVDPWSKEERTMPIRCEWGKDDKLKREWVAVRDSGVGMTLDQIKRYLSALGRSYYKSAEFNAEARVMREKGLLANPISQFGIGILSCFMIADWIEVTTCPCGHDSSDRKAWRVKITGPGALFHFAEWKSENGEKLRAGTEVKLYLNTKFMIVDYSPRKLVETLRIDLSYEGPKERKESETDIETVQGEFNPAAAAARHVIWPRYSIWCGRSGAKSPTVMLDQKWHFDQLCPIDSKELVATAGKWNCPSRFVRGTDWHCWDWDDTHHTGSRIRLVIPRSAGADALHPLSSGPQRARSLELASFVEHDITSDFECRQRFLVKGMRVSLLAKATETLWQTSAGIGAWLWVDLCGEASPQLTADRSTIVATSGKPWDDWRSEIEALFNRWISSVKK